MKRAGTTATRQPSRILMRKVAPSQIQPRALPYKPPAKGGGIRAPLGHGGLGGTGRTTTNVNAPVAAPPTDASQQTPVNTGTTTPVSQDASSGVPAPQGGEGGGDSGGGDSGGGSGGGQQQQAPVTFDTAPDVPEQSGSYDDSGGNGGDDDGSDDGSSGDGNGGDDGGSDDGDGSNVAGEAPAISCYVQDGSVICTALVETPYGIIPMVAHKRLQKQVPNGPVNFAGESVHKDFRTQLAAEDLRQEVSDMCMRARLGDQNAMDTLAGCREAAESGDPQARLMHSYCVQWLNAHPIDSSISGESESTYRTAVRYANGPKITPEHVATICDDFAHGERDRNIIAFGYDAGATSFGDDRKVLGAKRDLDDDEQALLDLGHAMGLALAIQRLRMGAPVKEISEGLAWEFGKL